VLLSGLSESGFQNRLLFFKNCFLLFYHMAPDLIRKSLAACRFPLSACRKKRLTFSQILFNGLNPWFFGVLFPRPLSSRLLLPL